MNTWIISPNGWAWALLGIAAASLLIIALCSIMLTVRERRIWRDVANNPIRNHNVISRVVSNTNWIIYIWFSIGIIVLIFVIFDYDDGIKLRAQEASVSTILSILVTFLVAWQIWQTMTSREEINSMRDTIDRAQRQFTSLNQQLIEQRETVPHMIEATRLYSHAHTLRTVGKTDVINLREAYAIYLEAIVEFLQSNPTDFVDRCLAGMNRCQDTKLGAFSFSPDFDSDFVDRCNRNYDVIESMFNRLTQKQREEIRELHSARLQYHTPPAE